MHPSAYPSGKVSTRQGAGNFGNCLALLVHPASYCIHVGLHWEE